MTTITAARLAAALVLSAAFGGAVAAQDEDTRAPEKLVIGYEEEGKVDASPKACLAFVKETVEWEAKEMEDAAQSVCAARKRHVDAYGSMQRAYAKFAKTFNEDTRLDVATSVKSFEALVKSCIDYKFNLTTGGHNIAIDIIPNTIAADCLTMGTGLLEAETKRYNGD
jgi:hypothetical protein